MKCQACQFPATVRYIEWIDGQIRESHLCERCAQRNETIKHLRKLAARLQRKLDAGIPVARKAPRSTTLEYRSESAMTGNELPWFATGGGGVNCASCGHAINKLDQDFSLAAQQCPHCAISCLLFRWLDRFVQIIPELSPRVVKEWIALLQSLPSDQDSMAMMSYLQDLFDAMKD